MENVMSKLPDHLKVLIADMKGVMEKGLIATSGYKEPGWKGYRYPLLFNSDAAQKLYEEHDFPDNSIILSSFPKTGTNWIAEILNQMVYGFDEKLSAQTKAIPHIFSLLEGARGEKIELWNYLSLPRTAFLTHLPAPLLNFEKIRKSNSKVIVPIRNPKDQAVSWYHFSKGPSFTPIREHLNPDWPQFFSDYIEGKQPIPVTKPGEGYAEFLLGWNEYKDDPNVFFVHFENLKKDPIKELRRMAKFLDIDLSEEQISIVREKTSFDAMKKRQEDETSQLDSLRKSMNLIRKGKVGSWKDTFTVAQSEMMDDMMSKKLSGTDIEFVYL